MIITDYEKKNDIDNHAFLWLLYDEKPSKTIQHIVRLILNQQDGKGFVFPFLPGLERKTGKTYARKLYDRFDFQTLYGKEMSDAFDRCWDEFSKKTISTPGSILDFILTAALRKGIPLSEMKGINYLELTYILKTITSKCRYWQEKGKGCSATLARNYFLTPSARASFHQRCGKKINKDKLANILGLLARYDFMQKSQAFIDGRWKCNRFSVGKNNPYFFAFEAQEKIVKKKEGK